MRLNELEIKIAITSEEQFKQVQDRCIELFGPPISLIRQLDEYYDNVDGHLKQQDFVLRIRTTAGKKIIGMKSPRINLPSGMTKRVELEFESSAQGNIQEQLLKQGLHANESYEKERWTFICGECEIVMDKLPFIGTFVEIEGPNEAAIHEIVKLLGLSSCEVIQKHYGELFKAKFHELKLNHSHATFANEKLCLNN